MPIKNPRPQEFRRVVEIAAAGGQGYALFGDGCGVGKLPEPNALEGFVLDEYRLGGMRAGA